MGDLKKEVKQQVEEIKQRQEAAKRAEKIKKEQEIEALRLQEQAAVQAADAEASRQQ